MGCPNLTWYGETGGSEYTAEDGAITVAMVCYCASGETDGSLVAFARLVLAARGIVDPTEPSPAGWYWSGTVHERGVWTPPAGPFDTAEAAQIACQSAPWSRQ